MKKIFSSLLALCLIGTSFIGCTQKNASPSSTDLSSEKISVISTIFAPYDFARQIVGDHAEVTMLLPPGSESHSFEPTPQDIIKIQNCDVFVYVGGDSDAWVDSVLDSMDTSQMEIIKLMDCVTVVDEEIVEGMEDDHGHSHGDEEFNVSEIRDRPMSDFSGEWISGVLLINDGSLDAYLAQQAEEDNLTLQEEKNNTLSTWASEYEKLRIEDNMLIIDNQQSPYSYQGYQVVESDHGTSVWYNFQIDTPNETMPTYITFNDHGHGEEIHEDHDHGEDHEEIGHIHLKYGNQGFDALINDESSSPFYFDAAYSNAEIGDFMAGHEHEEAELDEHVWTSPKNAKLIVQKMSDTFSAVDEKNAEVYKENTEVYLEKLTVLDEKFEEVVKNGTRKTLVFGDRFPFRYFARDYGLDYFAAFPGCSTETEPSASTVAFLIDKVKSENIPVVFHVELSNQKMANTISEETGAKVLLFHACHNVSKSEFENGVTYVELMDQNVENLKEALQ